MKIVAFITGYSICECIVSAFKGNLKTKTNAIVSTEVFQHDYLWVFTHRICQDTKENGGLVAFREKVQRR